MGTEQRYDIYDLFLRYPDPLVPRRHRLEVAERMDRDGNAITPLDRDAVRAAARAWSPDGVEAIAVCFLHAYRNPAHEREAGEDHSRAAARTSRSRCRPTSSPSCGNTSAASPPAPTPSCSR